MSLDPISVFHSPMSLILQKTHNSLLAGDTHLSNSKPKLTANVEMQMEQQIKTYFSFSSQDPRLAESLVSQVPSQISASGQELLTHHNVPISEGTCRHVTGRWEAAPGHVTRVSAERFQSCPCSSLLPRAQDAPAGALKVLSCHSPHSSS